MMSGIEFTVDLVERTRTDSFAPAPSDEVRKYISSGGSSSSGGPSNSTSNPSSDNSFISNTSGSSTEGFNSDSSFFDAVDDDGLVERDDFDLTDYNVGLNPEYFFDDTNGNTRDFWDALFGESRLDRNALIIAIRSGGISGLRSFYYDDTRGISISPLEWAYRENHLPLAREIEEALAGSSNNTDDSSNILDSNLFIVNSEVSSNSSNDLSDFVRAIRVSDFDTAYDAISQGLSVNAVYEGRTILEIVVDEISRDTSDNDGVELYIANQMSNGMSRSRAGSNAMNINDEDDTEELFVTEERRPRTLSEFIISSRTNQEDTNNENGIERFARTTTFRAHAVSSTASVESIRSGQITIIKLLLAKGAKPSLGVLCKLVKAKIKGIEAYLYEVFRKYPNHFKDIINEPLSDGMTLLMVIAEIGDITLLKFFIDLGANVNVTGESGTSVLDVALQELYRTNDQSVIVSQLAIIELLFTKKAKFKLIFKFKLEIIRRLIVEVEGIEIYFQKMFEKHPDYFKSIVNKVDGSGMTLLMLASVVGKRALVEFLVKKAGAKIDFVNPYTGYTALFYAASEGNLNIVGFLSSRGAQGRITDPITSEWVIAEDLAREKGHKKVADFLSSQYFFTSVFFSVAKTLSPKKKKKNGEVKQHKYIVK